MSPASRGRKSRKSQKNNRNGRYAGRANSVVLPAPHECNCPACTGEDLNLEGLVNQIAGDAAGLGKAGDPLEVELAGAALLAISSAVPIKQVGEATVARLIPALEARAGAGAMAMLLGLGAVAGDRVGAAARAAADRLADGGVDRPGWAAELDDPVTVSGCLRLLDPEDTGSVLSCSFHRGGRSHAVVISVDHLDCGAADDILLLPGDTLPEVLATMRAPASGIAASEEALDPADFRWYVETALDARAVHDGQDGALETGDPRELFDGDGPGYPVLAALVRARMSELPVPNRPLPPHAGGDDDDLASTMLANLARLVGDQPDGSGARGRREMAALPAPPDRSGQEAPVYRLKVALRGAKPPIWRRLEVPADLSLDQLHEVIQIAFEWHGYHLHVFETPYGDFGTDDADLGHRDETSVTLERVAPGEKSKLRYTYDFGDDWEHEIVVEKVLDRDPKVAYPRCTGGRRAAPPEDCGGVWGYAELVEAVSDPDHPEHADWLERLGLGDAADFDPAEFDAAALTKELAAR